MNTIEHRRTEQSSVIMFLNVRRWLQSVPRSLSTPMLVSLTCSRWNANKQLLDEVFMIFRIIKVQVRVIGRSRRLRLITLDRICNCFIIH